MIQFKDVSFKYEESKSKILNNINLTIEDGEVICLTGTSGCGKTTLTRLLMVLFLTFIRRYGWPNFNKS